MVTIENLKYVENIKNAQTLENKESMKDDKSIESMTFIDEIISNQKKYFLTNETLDLNFRKEKLRKLKEAIKSHEKDILMALKEDLGKNELESFFTEIGSLYQSIDTSIKKLNKWAKTERVRTPIYQYGKSYIESIPYGLSLIVAPFNYPFHLAISPLIAAVSAGNCSIIKPSELAENTANIIEKIISEVFSENHVSVIKGGADVSQKLVSSPFDYIFFTGSVSVGKKVMKAAADNLVAVTLELGGKSPAIVDGSFDLKTAAERIVWGKLINNGQTCIAPDYILVKEEYKESLVKNLISSIKDLYGEDIKNNSDYGRIINYKHTKRIIDLIKKDEKLIVYGGNYNYEEKFVEPTILDVRNNVSASMEEELFAPILPIKTYKNQEDLFREIRQHDKPLAMYIFSKDKSFQKEVMRNIQSGNVSINDTMKHFSIENLPFGGVGNSGIGKYHGKFGFESFSHKRGVYDNRSKFNLFAIFPPYTEKKMKLLKMLFK